MKKIFYGWWVVAATFPISLYVSGIVYYGFTALFEPLIKEFGWSYTEVSLAASLRGMESGIFAPLVGLLVDRLGSRTLILSGTVITGLGLILLSFTRSLPMFYGSFLLLALGAGGCMALVSMSAVAHWFEKNAGRAFGVMSSAFGASGLMVPFIVWLIDAFNWRGAVILLGVGLWIFGVPLALLIRNKPEPSTSGIDGVPSEDTVSRHENRTGNVKVSLKHALRNRSFVYLVVAETIRTTAVLAVVTHVMPYLSHVGISRSTASLVAAALPLGSIAGRFGFGWVSDVYEKKYVMALAYFLMGAGLVMFCFVQVKWFLPLFLLLFCLGFGGATVLRVAILKDYFGTASFGKMLGIVMGAASAGSVLGPTLAGWVFDTFRNYRSAWLVLIGLMGVAILMIVNLKEPRSDATPSLV